MASKKSRNDLDEAVKILKGEYGKCFCHTYFLCILQQFKLVKHSYQYGKFILIKEKKQYIKIILEMGTRNPGSNPGWSTFMNSKWKQSFVI